MYKVAVSKVVEHEFSLHATLAEAMAQRVLEEQDRGLGPVDYCGTQICPQTGERMLVEIKEVKGDESTDAASPRS